jgi:hypothetical protein
MIRINDQLFLTLLLYIIHMRFHMARFHMHLNSNLDADTKESKILL